ncbi:MAG: AIPR family protein [Clostridia bacterium]|nr:AIPR family protein [Clostridia bacterium]
MYNIIQEDGKVRMTFSVKSFKRFANPYNEKAEAAKYQCFVNAKDIPEDLEDWMDVNPREQNLGTDVSKSITKSLLDKGNENFHLLNRGLLISVEKITFNNKTDEAEIVLSDHEKHGIIDGGHTFKIVCQNKDKIEETEKFVSIEFIENFDIIENLAEARNTSVAVDDSSMEELRGSFDCFKNIFETHTIGGDNYFKRIRFKQNEHRYDENISNIIDIKEIIAITNMFNPYLYCPSEAVHPIQSYSGKEVSLRRFLKVADQIVPPAERTNKRNEIIMNMSDVIKDVLALWDTIEREFPEVSKDINRKYGSKKYSNYKNDAITKISLFSNKNLDYTVPKGIIYPCLGAFRALIEQDKSTGKVSWSINPFGVWKKLGSSLVNTILDNSKTVAGDKPEIIGKSQIIWDSLYNQVLIYKLKNK